MKVFDVLNKKEYDIDITHFNTPHPAKWSDVLLEVIYRDYIEDNDIILDVFGGTGKIGKLKEYGCENIFISQEIEEEWALQGVNSEIDFCFIADATSSNHYEKYTELGVNFIITSPAYGNRMADKHEAKDGSKRYTYKHLINRKLHDNNSGGYRFYGAHKRNKYHIIHEATWLNCYNMLPQGGKFLLNCSNYLVKGVEILVTEWHIDLLKRIGFTLIEEQMVKTPRLRVGQNSDKRVIGERLCLFKK